MHDILKVVGGKITLTEREVVNRIQQIRLANAVISYKAIDIVGEGELCLTVIFKIVDVQFL